MPPLPAPQTDPTRIFELFRGSYGSELLTAAIAHFNVFGYLAEEPQNFERLAEHLGLERRPSVVLITALRAMGLLTLDSADKLGLTPLAAEHLTPRGQFDVSDYVGLAASSPAVLEMVARLKTNQPAGAEEESGTAFIYRQGIPSAMERTELARHFTLALCGRAKNVAPVLAQRMPIESATTLLDVGGGTGIYSIAYLRQHPELRAIVLDRPEVLKIAAGFATEYGVADRIEFFAADMFTDALPTADVILLSNVLHDWDVPECQSLVMNCAAALTPRGKLIIHDVLLNDALDGPLPIALYSAALFTLTEGRAYSAAEYRGWLESAGLQPQPPVETAIHCQAIVGIKIKAS